MDSNEIWVIIQLNMFSKSNSNPKNPYEQIYTYKAERAQRLDSINGLFSNRVLGKKRALIKINHSIVHALSTGRLSFSSSLSTLQMCLAMIKTCLFLRGIALTSFNWHKRYKNTFIIINQINKYPTR